jgi:xyloglucan-specific exo-beta-1,4-glucanase
LTLYLDGTVGTTTGLFRTVDGGSTWAQINDATQQSGGSILDVTGDMRTFGTVYVSTNGRGIIWDTSANQEVRGIT